MRADLARLDFRARLRSLRPMRAPAPRACLVVLAIVLLAGPAAGYDYRTLHMIEDRHTHAIIRVSEPPPEGDRIVAGWQDCSQIEGLDRRGRNIARAFGRMFQRSGIHIDDILTSRLCRNIEAARLMAIGPADETELLDPAPDEAAAKAQADDILGRLDGLRPSETAMLITHPDIVTALTGESLAPGEGLVFRLPPFGDPEVRARFDLPPH